MKEYLKFLSVEENELKHNLNIVATNNRDILMGGNFSYPIIISNLKERTIISCSKKYKSEFDKNINDLEMINKENMSEILNEFAKKYFEKYEIKEMYRLIKMDKNEKIKCDNVELIDESKKEYFFNIIKRSNDKDYKESKWVEFNLKKARYRN